MTQRSLHWNGSTLGDADTYTVLSSDGIGYRLSHASYESPFMDRMFRAIWNGTGNRGVLKGWNNELEVTSIGAAPNPQIQVDTGAGIIYGLFYENQTAAVAKALTRPTSDTRYDRIVIRRNWTTQTARVYVITGMEGSPAPGITQSPAPVGSGIYDIPLATVEVDTAGNVVSITDDREYCTYSTPLSGTTVVDLFTTASFADDSVGFAQRSSREKVAFVGGGDLIPNVAGGYHTYSPYGDTDAWTTYTTLLQGGPPNWGGDADEEAWQTTGTAKYMGLYANFVPPPDIVADTTITSYIWWVNNAAVAVSATLYTHVVRPSVTLPNISTATITAAATKNKVYRTQGITLEKTYGHQPIEYYVAFYNASGADDIGIMGIEFRYQGY